MGAFEKISGGTKKDMVRIWKDMDEEDKDYFVDQVALALSIWGGDSPGKTLVAKVLATLIEDGSENLADFGLYIEEYISSNGGEARKGKMERASGIIARYRLKNALSSVPHKEIEL
ncbi:MAG: hypothetical protein GY852_03875 [bacterium]|nr:hypothetical protein [bacterium]